MRRLIPQALLATAFCILSAAGASAANYYIATNGSDSNNGSKTTPWLHAPGMQGASGNAAGYSPKPGDNFIFRGCDTWTASGAVFVNVSNSGSSGNYISYGGIDQTWYNTSTCPSGWNRPIFSGGGTWPASGANYKFFATPGSHIQIEWIEFTNGYTTGSYGYLTSIDPNVGSDIQMFQNYWHGMSAASLAGSGGSASTAASSNSCGPGGSFHDNYVDLSDSSAYAQGVWAGVAIGCYMDMYRNYFSNLMTCANGNFVTVHDNWFNNCGIPATAGALHANNFESNGDASNGSLYYNNLTTNVSGASPVQFQIGPPTGATTYVFNNVAVNTATSSAFFSCSNGIGAIQGTCIEFNNTNEGGNDPSPDAACTQNGDKGPPSPTVEYLYNHCVTNSSSYYIQKNGSSITSTGAVVQTSSQANGQNYSMATFFAPQSSSAATVGVGGTASTMQGYCTTIGANFGAEHQTACQSDTTLAVSIDTTMHQVTGLGRSATLRPTSGNWDAGAYQYSGAVAVNPPSGLKAIVQ